ncbi:hypothetical protein Y032_0828g2562 [Ancylostoma ceylanicum]|uniref:Uncharacterized protein n=1 Tax=Ancylostoma ceylanicum TaxID=53326 RepID=A0A016WCU5_9BILA|nr:hypothetical protein Y032_0828g2562 [Ancylostoma ceylanicum]
MYHRPSDSWHRQAAQQMVVAVRSPSSHASKFITTQLRQRTADDSRALAFSCTLSEISQKVHFTFIDLSPSNYKVAACEADFAIILEHAYNDIGPNKHSSTPTVICG